MAGKPLPNTTPAARAIKQSDMGKPQPLYGVWELTMKCDQQCPHCGSRAGKARPRELSTEELVEVAQALLDLGCREMALIGGEAYLHPGVAEVVRVLAEGGVRVGMQTGGRTLTRDKLEPLVEAGLSQMGVSVDGPEEVHDILRGNTGSHAAALNALALGGELGIDLSANSQINRLNYDLLEPLALDLIARGVKSWQVQLTVPMGRAADRPEWIIEPWRVTDVIDTLAKIQLDAARNYQGGLPFNVCAGNNIGYFGPHEQTIRSRPGGTEAHWKGCQAGIYVIGIESDGTVKGCPSLPTAPYDGGNVLELSLEKIWERSEVIRFSRDRDTSELWGFCADCYYADTCRAGCSWTAHCTLGKRGNNPFCYHRVTQLKRQGLRERLVLKELAPNEPYDFGRYAIVEEPWDSETVEQPRRLRVL
jgi:radical SAM protein with 4Fe4S-binding SPASM domain